MKQMIRKIGKLGFLAFAVIGMAACNKDELTQKAVSVEIKGYNIGSGELEVSIDTVVYDKFRTAPNKLLNFGRVYTYPSSRAQAVLKIKDLASGREVYQAQLDLEKNDFERFFPFVLIDGSPLAINAPVVDPSTNKMVFYIHYPQSSDLIDVFMRNDVGQQVYIAKNVAPGTWTSGDYLTTDGFRDANKDYTWCFVKAGTLDQWAFNDEYLSVFRTGTLAVPKNDEKGRVQSYFVTPASNQLDIVSLFKR
ncbi:MAG: hypothetical protein EOO88_04420 [Pedobacter sp.]|nr:MAG: hypothetical protein EOO88_04420 [Pedobacter sp.]